MSAHHEPKTSVGRTSRCAGYRRPPLSRRVSVDSSVTGIPSSSMQINRSPTADSSRSAVRSARLPSAFSARATVDAGVLARTASSRWLRSVRRRPLRKAHATSAARCRGDIRQESAAWRCRGPHARDLCMPPEGAQRCSYLWRHGRSPPGPARNDPRDNRRMVGIRAARDATRRARPRTAGTSHLGVPALTIEAPITELGEPPCAQSPSGGSDTS